MNTKMLPNNNRRPTALCLLFSLSMANLDSLMPLVTNKGQGQMPRSISQAIRKTTSSMKQVSPRSQHVLSFRRVQDAMRAGMSFGSLISSSKTDR